MWSILGLVCVILKLVISILCGCNDLKLSSQGLQGGVLPSWTLSASLLWTRIILSDLWIQKIFCVGAPFYQPLHKVNNKRMVLISHPVPRTVMITMNTLLPMGSSSLANSDFIISPQVLWLESSHALPLGARCWPLSCTSVSIHLGMCFQSGWGCPGYSASRYGAAGDIGRDSCTSQWQR